MSILSTSPQGLNALRSISGVNKYYPPGGCSLREVCVGASLELLGHQGVREAEAVEDDIQVDGAGYLGSRGSIQAEDLYV